MPEAVATPLQPSLLDRLTDSAPSSQVESRDQRVINMRRLRECVLRDLSWLFNTSNITSEVDLSDYPEVATSVLNYGLPDLTGATVHSVQIREIERRVRQGILDFEPRLMPAGVRVRAVLDTERMSHNALVFNIEATLWGNPAPMHLYLKTELDLESGQAKVTESSGGA